MSTPSHYITRLAAFITSHGFPAMVNAAGSQVSFSIPYTSRDGKGGFETYTVSTLAEARDALGY